MSSFIDITGERYGMLTVLSLDSMGVQGARWVCRCDCGIIKTIGVKNLRSGSTVSCGCYAVKSLKEMVRSKVLTHGHLKGHKVSPTYRTWVNMISRCTNKNIPNYQDYGGRGIVVCERWRKFTNFLEDMGERPKGMSIDRIDVNGSYCKENCRWATNVQQSNNRRSNHTITYGDKTLTISQWARELNMKQQTLWRRLNVGWSIEDAFTKEIRNTESKGNCETL